MKKITVRLNRYRLDISNAKDKEEYSKIKEICKEKGYRLFDYIDLAMIGVRDKRKDVPSGIYEIDTKHLFSSQYNTVKTKDHLGYRIHDWSEIIHDNRRIKSGYYLSEEEDLKKLRDNRYECKWCGAQYEKEEAEKIKYCDKCRGGLELEEKYYNLLVLRPIAYSGNYNETIPDYIVKDILDQQKEN